MCTICKSADLYFLIQWQEEEEEDLYDVLPARDIKANDVFSLSPGDQCKASFSNKLYNSKVVAHGTFESAVVLDSLHSLFRKVC